MVSHNSLTALEKDFHGLPVLCMADLAHNNIKAINIQLALKTQCKMHGLNSTLRIYLQGKEGFLLIIIIASKAFQPMDRISKNLAVCIKRYTVPMNFFK